MVQALVQQRHQQTTLLRYSHMLKCTVYYSNNISKYKTDTNIDTDYK